MGPPILDLQKIPVEAKWLGATAHPRMFHVPVDTSLGVPATFVSMGNPHAVIFTGDVAKIDLAKVGPQLETHKAFPRRINVHFVQVHSPSEVTMRTWERGSGIHAGVRHRGVGGMRRGRADRQDRPQDPRPPAGRRP